MSNRRHLCTVECSRSGDSAYARGRLVSNNILPSANKIVLNNAGCFVGGYVIVERMINEENLLHRIDLYNF